MNAPIRVTDILDFRDRLVSPYTGIVRSLQRVHKGVTEPVVPHIWRAELANHLFAPKLDPDMAVASGKGVDEASAMRSALGEAVERYCGFRFPTDRCRVAARSDLHGPVLEPEKLVLHSDEQLEGLGFARYSRDEPIAWIEGCRVNDGIAAMVPAQAVYLISPPDTPVFFHPTSNGLAAGQTQKQCRLRAILEVVERDAFLAAWYHRLPVKRIDLNSHPDRSVAGIVDAYGRRSVSIEAYVIPMDHEIPVVIGLAVEERDGGVAAVVGLGADRRLADAVRGAVLEVAQVRPAIRMKLRDAAILDRRERLVENPSLVDTLDDHDLLYTDRRMLPAFEIWRTATHQAVIAEEGNAGEEDLGWVIEQISGSGSQTYVCDLTTPDIAPLGLHVCRAIVEDFQPIHFGERQFRKGGKRFHELPARLGLPRDSAHGPGLNPLPHPLA